MEQNPLNSVMLSQPDTNELVLPLLPFHIEALAANAYDHLDSRRRKLTQTYFTTEATIGDLRSIAEVNTRSAVMYLLLTGIQTIFEHLPPDVQEQFNSPKDTLQLKSRIQTPLSRRRISEGVSGVYQGSLSLEHKQHISASVYQYWQRQREQKQK